jgi:hypothetical protein
MGRKESKPQYFFRISEGVDVIVGKSHLQEKCRIFYPTPKVKGRQKIKKVFEHVSQTPLGFGICGT